MDGSLAALDLPALFKTPEENMGLRRSYTYGASEVRWPRTWIATNGVKKLPLSFSAPSSARWRPPCSSASNPGCSTSSSGARLGSPRALRPL